MAEMLLLKHFFFFRFWIYFLSLFRLVCFLCCYTSSLLFISYGIILNQRGSKVNRRSWIVDILYVFLFSRWDKCIYCFSISLIKKYNKKKSFYCSVMYMYIRFFLLFYFSSIWMVYTWVLKFHILYLNCS